MPDNKTALTLLAHPDDAEFLCGGVLIRLADAGWDIHIATMTPGDCGTTSRTPWEIGSVRTNEGRKAAELIGGTYHCLDERDIFVCYDKPTLRKAVDLFRRVAPSLVFTHAPKDYMMDHEMTSLVARAASFGYGAPNASAHPLKEGSGVPYLYYCDPLGGVDPLGNLVTPTTLIDISAQIEKKAAMLACHESQREWLRAHHGMDEYIESMRRQSTMRGEQAGVAYAEAFTQHRGHPYPHDDVLVEMFGNGQA
jgi:LmbE family N-acetylglucosaminyl deacetylase